MNCAIVRFSGAVLAALLVLATGLAAAAGEQAVPDDSGRRPAIQYRLTTEKIRDVQISEEAPGRFIAILELTDAHKKALSELTGTHVGEDLEVTIADEPVLHMEIRGAIEEISIGPWMNKGLADLFARCLTKCGPKKCL